jgi:peptide/nickel transport system ATP-binding protein
VSYAIAPGRTLGVVGESGCGKSMTALALMGLVPAPGRVSGSVRFEGRELVGQAETGWRALRGARIAMVFQEPMTSLNPVMTIGRQIAEVMVLHQDFGWAAAEGRAVELLAAVGIPSARERAAAYPHQLSGGMRQRAMIAMALSCNPQVVIADEPTTALDVMIQAQILELLDALRKKLGLSIIFVTHDLGVVAEMCDSVLVMYGGVTAEYADVDTIYNAPRHPYTQELLKAFPDLSLPEKRLVSIPGYPPKLDALPPGCRFAPRCPLAFERCTVETPELHSLNGGGHVASCHLVEWSPRPPSSSMPRRVEQN